MLMLMRQKCHGMFDAQAFMLNARPQVQLLFCRVPWDGCDLAASSNALACNAGMHVSAICHDVIQLP